MWIRYEDYIFNIVKILPREEDGTLQLRFVCSDGGYENIDYETKQDRGTEIDEILKAIDEKCGHYELSFCLGKPIAIKG